MAEVLMLAFWVSLILLAAAYCAHVEARRD